MDMDKSLNNVSNSKIIINRGSTKLLIVIVILAVVIVLNRDWFISEHKQTDALVEELDRKNSQLDQKEEKIEKQDTKYAQLQEKYRIMREEMAKKYPDELEELDQIYQEKGLEAAIYFMEVVFEKDVQNNEAETVIEEKFELLEKVIIKSNSVIIDGLEYENIPFTETYTWDEANAYCEGKGWRLPMRKELHKISDIEIYEYDNYHNWKMWFDEHKEQRLQNSKGYYHFVRSEFIENMSTTYSCFWTSEERDSSLAWLVSFYGGAATWYDRSSNRYALCVR